MNLLMLLVPVAFGMALGAIALTSTYMRLGSRLILVAVSAAMVGFGALGAARYMSFARIAHAVVQIIFVGGAALLAIALALVVVALLRMVRRNRRMQTRLRRPSNSSPVE
jgi:ABC-type multidrug transport system permease subunit